MNRVGQGGKGESVWLGWFLHTILWEFSKIADARGEFERAETWRLQVSALKAALEREGWDGGWYRRAFFDDGTPLGSSTSIECRMDSIAQSWGVISGGAERGRAVRAMDAVNQQLVRPSDGIVLLLTPPFDRSPEDPGYIKGYVPGIRENGGQYTHAAVWTLIAFCGPRGWRQSGRIAHACSSPSIAPAPAPECSVTRWNPTFWRVTCTPKFRISGAAAGPGTRAQPAGSIARASNGCLGFACAARIFTLIPAFHALGRHIQ